MGSNRSVAVSAVTVGSKGCWFLDIVKNGFVKCDRMGSALQGSWPLSREGRVLSLFCVNGSDDNWRADSAVCCVSCCVGLSLRESVTNGSSVLRASGGCLGTERR